MHTREEVRNFGNRESCRSLLPTAGQALLISHSQSETEQETRSCFPLRARRVSSPTMEVQRELATRRKIQTSLRPTQHLRRAPKRRPAPAPSPACHHKYPLAFPPPPFFSRGSMADDPFLSSTTSAHHNQSPGKHQQQQLIHVCTLEVSAAQGLYYIYTPSASIACCCLQLHCQLILGIFLRRCQPA